MSKKHFENARGFVLVLLLLAMIAAGNVIWVSITARSLVDSQARKYRMASLASDARLSLRSYLLDGDSRMHQQLDSSLQDLRELCTGNEALQEWSEWEQNWSRTFAEPLIAERMRLDAGQGTVAELSIRYLQANPLQEERKFRSLTTNSGLHIETPPRQRYEIDTSWLTKHMVIAIVIFAVAMLAAGAGLHSISVLGRTKEHLPLTNSTPSGMAR